MPLRTYIPGRAGRGEVTMRIYSRAADAMEQTYAAWRAFIEERNIPVPDWETLSAHVAVDSQLTDTLLQENPLRLAEEPLHIIYAAGFGLLSLCQT